MLQIFPSCGNCIHVLFPPTITNLQHDTQAEGPALTSQICEAYKGNNRPRSCIID